MSEANGIGDDEELTQYTFVDDPPRNRPRPVDQDGLSLLRGRLDVIGAARFIRRKVKFPYEGDGVRVTMAGTLRAAGFVVTATPSRAIPIHVSVQCETEWEEETAQRFDECFR